MLCNGSGDGISAPPRPPPLARRPVSAVAPPPMPGQSRLQCPGCWHWKHTSWLRYAGSGLRSGGLPAPAAKTPLSRRPPSAAGLPPSTPGQSRVQCPGCRHLKHTSWLRYAGGVLGSGGLPAPAAKTPLSRRPPSAAGLPPPIPGQSRLQCPGCWHLKQASWPRFRAGDCAGPAATCVACAALPPVCAWCSDQERGSSRPDDV